MRRGPARLAPTPVPTPVTVPDAPTRLPPAPEFARFAAPATVQRPMPVTASVTIRLRGLPTAVRTAEMGIATFDAVTGAGFSWTPIGDAANGTDDLVLRAEFHGTCEQAVVLASQRAFARHGYLARTTFTPSRNPTTEIELDSMVSTTRFQLPNGALRSGPLRLVRVDDPQWLPMENGTTGVVLASAEPATLLLGAGTYELQDPIHREKTQRFVVPAAGPIVLNADLTVAAADRP